MTVQEAEKAGMSDIDIALRSLPEKSKNQSRRSLYTRFMEKS